MFFLPAAQFAYRKCLGCADALLPYLITFRSPYVMERRLLVADTRKDTYMYRQYQRETLVGQRHAP